MRSDPHLCWRLLFEANPQPMLVLDPETRRFLAVNDAAVRHYGYTRAEFLAISADSIRPPEEVPGFHAFLARPTRGVTPAGTWTHVRKDGTSILVELTVTELEFAGRSARLVIVEDVTRRQRMIEELGSSRATLQAIIEASPLGFAVLDEKLRVELWNPAAERILGWSAAEVVGGTLPAVAGDGIGEIRQELDRVLAGAPVRWREVRRRRKDGATIEAMAWLAPFPAGNRPGRRVVGIIQDITERRRREAELRRLATAIEQAAEAIMIADADANIRYVNPAFERITGYTREEVLGRNPRILKSGEQPPEFYAGLWESLTAGHDYTARFVNRRKDGRLYTQQATISPIRDPSGAITSFVAVARDITREIELDRQLHQAQKMEAVGLLAGGIAHDFNNLLTVIQGNIHILLSELPAEAPIRDDLGHVLAAAEQAARLTRGLLAFSRKQVLRPRVLDLNVVVAEMQQMLRRVIGEDVELEASLPPSLGRVRADPGQLQQVIMNLAVNARDAMPRGGRLTLETADVELDEDYARAHAGVEPGRYVRLSVSDTGHGMDRETASRIFEPFFTTKEKGKGTGLGLSTVYGIVKQSGGHIWVYSEPGQGTTFKIYLPRVEGEAEEEAAAGRAEAPEPDGTETVLLVEDEEPVRALARRILERRGYRVLEAADGPAALRVSDSTAGIVDLLLTDVVMPGMNGRELAERLTRRRPGLRVLFMSGYTEDEVVHRGVLPSGAGYLEKPFTPEVLARKVEQVLGGTRPRGDAESR